nr:MAG TPA: hypothetical protein [Caudoviricetes sp.]
MIDLQNSQEAHSVSFRLKPTKRFFCFDERMIQYVSLLFP